MGTRKKDNRSITPIKSRNNSVKTCQSDNFLNIPVTLTVPHLEETIKTIPTRNRSKTMMLNVPKPKENKKPARSTSLDSQQDLQVSTFHGLTTPQSQLMKVLYLGDINALKKEPNELKPHIKKDITHLTVDAFVGNSSVASSSCDSFLSLTFSSSPQTPTCSPVNNTQPETTNQISDSVICEGQIMWSIFVEIVRYLILPMINLVIYLFCSIFEMEIEKPPTINIIGVSGSGSNGSNMVSNNVGKLLYDSVLPQEQSISENYCQEISLEVSETTLTREDSTIFKIFQQFLQFRTFFEGWLVEHRKTFFTRNGKSCRALVRNEMKHLGSLAGSEFSQAKSLTDLIDYWKKSI